MMWPKCVAAALLLSQLSHAVVDEEAKLMMEEMRLRIAQLEERLEVQSSVHHSEYDDEDDDEEKSLLEVFSATVSEFVVTRLLPRSDPECAFNYAKSVCVPKCKCSVQYKLGDYSMSRACRLKPQARLAAPGCDNSLEDERGALVKLGDVSRTALSSAWTRTNTLLHEASPKTDAGCDWSWDSLRCEPHAYCDLTYRFGDYHLGRSCRRRVWNTHDDDDEEDDDEEDNGSAVRARARDDARASTEPAHEEQEEVDYYDEDEYFGEEEEEEEDEASSTTDHHDDDEPHPGHTIDGHPIDR